MGLLGEHKIRGPFGTLLLHTLVPYHCSNPFKWIGLTNWLHSSYTGKDKIKKAQDYIGTLTLCHYVTFIHIMPNKQVPWMCVCRFRWSLWPPVCLSSIDCEHLWFVLGPPPIQLVTSNKPSICWIGQDPFPGHPCIVESSLWLRKTIGSSLTPHLSNVV
jgi:hypothetical protein